MAQSIDGRFARVFAFSPVALALIAEDGEVLDANPALARLLDLTPDQIRGHRMVDFTHPEDKDEALAAVGEVADGNRESVQIEKRMHDRQGEQLPVRVTVLGLDEPGGASHRLAQIEDLSTGPEHEQLRRQAGEDPLTGLANRRTLHGHLEPLLDRQQSTEGGPHLRGPVPPEWSLLFVDLNGFKDVNDTYGHRVGDLVLVAVAERLANVTHDADLVCRLGGDEFVLLLPTAAPDEVSRAAERVRESLAQCLEVEGHSVRISASVGAAVPQRGDSVEHLLDRADAAMYRDKRR
jgi:diguanylate cyclase (GGDEF)-like protein/PAS domain S-box-containing protein